MGKARFSPRKVTLAEKLEFHSSKQPNGCIIWTGALDKYGYGKFRFRRAFLKAHRAAWLAVYGPIQKPLQVCHSCDNRACINPDHLWLGTNQQNTADRNAKQRQARGERITKTHLTAEQVRAIRADERTQEQIGEAYGVRQTTVSRIKRREVWKHVE